MVNQFEFNRHDQLCKGHHKKLDKVIKFQETKHIYTIQWHTAVQEWSWVRKDHWMNYSHIKKRERCIDNSPISWKECVVTNQCSSLPLLSDQIVLHLHRIPVPYLHIKLRRLVSKGHHTCSRDNICSNKYIGTKKRLRPRIPTQWKGILKREI